MATNIKITALTDITSANVTYNDLLAVVDMNGTPETKKGNLQLVGNLILEGAGGSYFAKAAQATNAETVSNAAQPAITSVGSLTAVTVTGNVDAGNVNGTAGVFTYVSGDGANLTNVPAGAATSITDGTSNVDIPTTDGNVTVGVGGTADVLIATSTGVNVTGTLNATGIITGDAGGISNVVYANVTGTPTLGNISTINIDGNVSNVLRGDGTFAADADTAYGDSNVVTLLNAFGSNTITTTGVITGVGSGLSGLVGANVTGEVTNAATANAVAGANVSGEVGFSAVSNSVAGANVSGEVTFAATANAVAYANVSGTPTLGNISTINIDGAAANVLYGNGVFAAAPGGGSYGDSNVVTLLNAFGSNTITTTGVISGVGSGLSAIAGGNVSGAVALATLATDATSANAVAGANVSGEVNFAATANAVAGANVSGEVTFAATANAVAYANVSGTPTLGNISTFNIDGNSANYLDGTGSFGPVTATTAVLAQEVINSAQPNIGSVGTLTSLDVTGNISGGNINANTNGFAIGYKEIPPVVLSGNDTIALEDSGKHFRSTTAGNITLSIPTNATVSFPTGTAISIVEQAAGNILVNAISGVTLYHAGNSTAGNRVISTYGVATLMKVDTDTWFISGTGVS